MEGQPHSSRAGPSAEASSSSSSRLEPSASSSSGLHHKSSLATTRSTSSASSLSFQNYPTSSPLPSRPLQPTIQTDRPKRVPVYVRIVPKDVWLRIHVDPTQSIGQIKDAALFKANVPDHDPSLSYRFYQDALNASAGAKIAPVASHDRVVRHRSYALPRTFACPAPDLSDVSASLAASFAQRRSSRKPSPSPHPIAHSLSPSSTVPSLPAMPRLKTGSSPRQAQAQQVALASTSPLQQAPLATSPSSRLKPSTLLHALAGSSSSARSTSDNVMAPSSAHVTRQLSSSTLATSPSSTPSVNSSAAFSSDTSRSQWAGATEIGITLDTSLITGNRDAKLEEDMARMRLSQWNARRSSSGMDQQQGTDQRNASSSLAPPSFASPQLGESPSDSINSTPAVASSSQFGDSSRLSPNVASSTGHDATSAIMDNAQAYAGSTPATPPRRTTRSGTATGTAPAILYTQPVASESFNSLASVGSPSSVDLLTTANDDDAVMQWGTQAEGPPSDQASPSKSISSSAFSPLSSPLQPSAAAASLASSPSRPRSRTVTAADVLRSRKEAESVPPMPDTVSSPVRNSSLPKAQGRKLVAESSQRRAVHTDLLELLKGAPEGEGDGDDDDVGYPTIKQRHIQSQKSFDSSLTGAGGAGADSSSPMSSHFAKSAGGANFGSMHADDVPGGWKDASHALSSKFAVLSAANGCELQEWQTAAAYKLRAYELLELQWAIPTERVYISPINIQETFRVVTPSGAAGANAMFKQSWTDDIDAGPDPEAVCLEPYFEGWVYVLKGGATPGKAERTSKSNSKLGKWKLHYVTVKGWRIDVYTKKPRAGEAVLPLAEQVWSLRTIEWVVESENAIPSSTALPALDTLPVSSLTVAFSRKSATNSSAPSSEGSTLTLRCITQFDHDALSTLLMRAWYRCSATAGGVDKWRRRAIFRAIVAGRGGTVAAGRTGRGRRGRNARSRMRLRPSGWPKEWEDADRWSSDSEREEIAPPPELEQAMMQQRRDTVTQIKADKAKKKKQEDEEKVMVPNGLYAALLGRTAGTSMPSDGETTTRATASSASPLFDSSSYHQGGGGSGGGSATVGRSAAQSPPLPQMEPGIMPGTHSVDRRFANPSASADSKPRRRRGSASSPPQPDSDAAANPSSLRSRGRSRSSAGRDSSPSRKSCHSGDGYTMAPPIAAGWVDIPPPPSLMLLKKYKASQKASNSSTPSSPSNP